MDDAATDSTSVVADGGPDGHAHLSNDGPGGAIDVSAGGTFTEDISLAMNDAPETGCGGDGGRDVFYAITLPTAEVVYFDTFGSSFGTSVRIYAGKQCGQINGNPNCTHDSCGGARAQIALQLPQGTSCIVVDQHAGDTSGALQLNVKRGGRKGQPLQSGVQAMTGDTCTGADSDNVDTTLDGCIGADDQDAKDLSYFFTVCPNTVVKLDASTCADPSLTHYDTIIYTHGWDKPQVACNGPTGSRRWFGPPEHRRTGTRAVLARRRRLRERVRRLPARHEPALTLTRVISKTRAGGSAWCFGCCVAQ